MSRTLDDTLRRKAQDALGALGDEVAYEALALGSLEIEHDVTSWESSHGTVRGHRVFVISPPPTHARVVSSPAAHDALSAAIAVALASRGKNEALFELRYEPGAPTRGPAGHPYRG